MRRAAIRRAIGFRGVAGRRRWVYLWGGLSAVATALLIIVAGVIINLLLQRGRPGEASLQRILEDLLQRPPAVPAWATAYDTSLLALLGFFLLAGAVEALLLLMHRRMAESAALQVTGGLEQAIYRQAARTGPQAAGDPAADAERLMSHECVQVREGLAAWWRSLPRGFILLPLLLVLALAADFFLTLYALLLLIFANWVYYLFFAALQTRIDDARRQAERRKALVCDQLRAAVTTALWSGEPREPAPFEQAAQRYHQQLQRAAYLDTARIPGFLLLMSLCIALLTVVVGLSTDVGMARVILLTVIYARGYLPAKRLAGVWGDAQRTDAAATAIFDFVDRQPPVAERAGAVPLGPLTASVRLEQVASTGGAFVDLSFSVPAGSRAAFASQDSHLLRTLRDLLLRLTDPTSGRVMVDNHDLRDVTFASLRRQVALAPVDGQLLSGTIADNIRCGRSGYGEEQLEQAAARAQVLDNIQSFPHGFHTSVGAQGRSLAADVAFRIGLARALLAEPSLLVVEEPPEPADEPARRRLDHALAAAADGRTLIVLPARLPTLRWVQRVYLFHDGRCQAEGEHAELLRQNALYRHWNYLWFNPLTKEGR